MECGITKGPLLERPNGSKVRVELFTQTRYRCPACRRSWSKQSVARKHIEDGCYKDPANRGCGTCVHYEFVDAEPEVGLGWHHECAKDGELFGQGDEWGNLPREDFASDCPLWETNASYASEDG